MKTLTPAVELTGRVLLAAIFVLSGVTKIGGYGATQAYMESAGVSGALLPLVIALEVGGGLAIVAGLLTRWAAVGLAGFGIISAFLFHSGADPVQQIMFLKNVSMAGGFLILAANGAGAWSLDRKLADRRIASTVGHGRHFARS